MIGGLIRNSGRFLLAGAGAIAILAASASGAGAATLEELEAAIADLQKQVAEAKAAAAAAQAAAADAGGGGLDLKVKWKGAPEFSSEDGKFKFKVRGRLHVDYNNIDQDSAITFAPDVDATLLRRARLGVEGVLFYNFKYVFEVDFANNNVAVRDAYLEYTGFDVRPIIGNYKTYNSLEHLISSNYITFMERAAFITAFGIDRQIGAGLGYYKDHFTLAAGVFGESVSSTPEFPGFVGEENLTVAGRATVAPLNREVNGVNQVLHFGASGRLREVGDDQPFLQYAVPAGQLALGNLLVNTGRIGESDTLWALEAAGVWGPLSVQAEYAQLEVDLPGGRFIRNPSTGKAAGSTPFFGNDCEFDAAADSCNTGAVGLINNPFLGVPEPTYDGWYVDASYFLTGETRPYKEGRFDRVKVKNPVRWEKGGGFSGWGAWQIAGRYDVLSLSDSAFNNDANSRVEKWTGGCANTRLGVNRLTVPDPTTEPPDDGERGADPARIAQCGQQESWVFGVNWYLNDHTRIMFNYIHQELSGFPTTNNRDENNTPGLVCTGATNNTPACRGPNGFNGADIDAFGMRVQYDW